MNYSGYQNNYLANEVMQASPKRLIELLLEGCIKNLKQATLAIEQKKLSLANDKLVRAQDIITELRYSVNEEAGGEVAQQFIQMYDFIENHLVQANIKKDVTIIAQAQKLVEELLDTWKQVEV